jgi:hypothetical protein
MFCGVFDIVFVEESGFQLSKSETHRGQVATHNKKD